MENPQDKKGQKTTYTCPHTAEHIYRPSNLTHTVVKRQTFSSSVQLTYVYTISSLVNMFQQSFENSQAGIKVKERFPSKELRVRLGTGDITLVLQLRWYGHVLRKGDDDWVKKCME